LGVGMWHLKIGADNVSVYGRVSTSRGFISAVWRQQGGMELGLRSHLHKEVMKLSHLVTKSSFFIFSAQNRFPYIGSQVW